MKNIDYTALAFYGAFLYFFVNMFLWMVGITL